MAELHDILPDLTPAEIKQMADNPPQTLKRELTIDDAKTLARRLRSLRAEVEIRDDQGEFVYENYREIKPPRPYPG